MSGEIIAIIAVGIALGGLGWRAVARLDRRIDRAEDARRADMQKMEETRRADMQRMEETRRADMQKMEETRRADMQRMEETRRADMQRIEETRREDMREIGSRMDRIEERLSRVEHGQAKLEGLLEGLRDSITGRRAA